MQKQVSVSYGNTAKTWRFFERMWHISFTGRIMTKDNGCVKAFLGSTQQMAYYVPYYALVAAPLHKLTRKGEIFPSGEKWILGSDYDMAFHHVRSLVLDRPNKCRTHSCSSNSIQTFKAARTVALNVKTSFYKSVPFFKMTMHSK